MNILKKSGTTPKKLVMFMTSATDVDPATEKLGIQFRAYGPNVGEQRKNRTLEGIMRKICGLIYPFLNFLLQ